MNLTEQKGLMRSRLKKQAAGLEVSYCREADRAIFKYITEMPEYRRAEVVFSFVGTAREIDTAPVIKNALENGKIVGVPRCVDRGIMDVCRIDSLECLKAGRYNIPEPGADAPVLLPASIDFAVVPCLSCSSDGRRLGYGGGYYDRYLAGIRAFKAVICRAGNMREDIPVDAHDMVMDAVISEMGVMYCPPLCRRH